MPEEFAIQLENLSKAFGRGKQRVDAVRDISLEIPSGVVFGFLGPNGAGKTTTIRMLMDLIRPTSGRAYLFGQDVRRKPDVYKRVGALVEEAAFYEHLTGRQNLEVLARTARDYRSGRVEYLLNQVGMVDRADQLVKAYSTGMKQRLGIAATLLTDPDLIILDEPTNGLDPDGIKDMRAFIRSLAEEQGKTVFLSSHQLREVERVCDRVAIINQGEVLREGAVGELLGRRSELRIRAIPIQEAHAVLSKEWQVTFDGAWISVRARPNESPKIIRQLVMFDVDVHEVVVTKQSLEEYFLAVTKSNEPTRRESEPLQKEDEEDV